MFLRSVPAILCCLAALLPVLGGAATAWGDEIMRLRADYWCPYNCTPGTDNPGYMVEIAARAATRLGITVEYALMPWDRTMSEVRTGSVDGAIGATSLEGDGLILSDPLGYDADCFFVTEGSDWRYQGPDSLNGVLLGAVSGYTHDEGPIDAYIAAHSGPKGAVVTSSGDEASARNVRLLLLGRIDAVLDSEAVVRTEANRVGRSALLRQVGCLKALPLHIAFSRQYKSATAMVEALKLEVAELRKSGRLAEILGRYGMVDWAK
ncbi:MAG: transporter substrate-binding domain-containing protein [Proteobacteria bacterium]|nr:transporter substrate-binding domain-containing protein [Pseudomonadota bacterium]